MSIVRSMIIHIPNLKFGLYYSQGPVEYDLIKLVLSSGYKIVKIGLIIPYSIAKLLSLKFQLKSKIGVSSYKLNS